MFWNDIQRLRQQAAPQGQPQMASPMPTAAPTQAITPQMAQSMPQRPPGLMGALQMAARQPQGATPMNLSRRHFLGCAFAVAVMAALPTVFTSPFKQWEWNLSMVDELNEAIEQLPDIPMTYDEMMVIKAHGGHDSDPAVILWRATHG